MSASGQVMTARIRTTWTAGSDRRRIRGSSLRPRPKRATSAVLVRCHSGPPLECAMERAAIGEAEQVRGLVDRSFGIRDEAFRTVGEGSFRQIPEARPL